MAQAVTKKLSSIEEIVLEIRIKIKTLKKELYLITTIVKEFSIASQQIAVKEAEKKDLKNQLRSIEASSQYQEAQHLVYTPPMIESFLSNLPSNHYPILLTRPRQPFNLSY